MAGNRSTARGRSASGRPERAPVPPPVDSVADRSYLAYVRPTPPRSRSSKIDRGGTDGAFTYTVSNGHEREPVMMVSFNDAMRFANWMHHLHAPHGGPGATTPVAAGVASLTETGAYDLPAGRDLAARSPGGVTPADAAAPLRQAVFERHCIACHDADAREGASTSRPYPGSLSTRRTQRAG